MAKIQSVYKDKKAKTWFYKKRFGKTWLIKKGFSSASEAKEGLDTALEEAKKNKLYVKESVNFYEFFESVAIPHFKRTLKDSTFQNRYKMYCKHFLYFKNCDISDIRQKDIALFKDYLQNLHSQYDKPMSSGYINHILSGLYQVFDLAVEREMAKENYARKVKKLKVRSKREIEYWTIQEFDTFFNLLDENKYVELMKKAGYYTLFFSGLRIGELMARKWSDVDWEQNMIYVNSTLNYRNKAQWSAAAADGTKTFSSKAWVKLSPKNIQWLKKWKSVQESIGKMDYIFMYDGTMFAPRNWTIWLDQKLEEYNGSRDKSEELKRIRVHDLRDSHAMWLLSMGVDLKTIQKRLRHENAKTTMSYYLDRLPEHETSILDNY
ncbi:tyrosine-type recombinase/integrase [Enterococcus sp. LJL51]|uniref:tyrosine-type recombinase/integrase n=1 Tax=Enterococcus sp. LJL51 TaxID=3416656 RepID=UPI003CFBA360